MLKNRRAFTLAEVLITLTIIGIFAIILIPQTIGQLKSDTVKIKFRNTYAQIQKGFNVAQNVDKVVFTKISKIAHENNNDNEKTNLDDFMRKYFKGVVVDRGDAANGNINVANISTGNFKTNFQTVSRTYKLPNGVHILVPLNTKNIIENANGSGCVPVANNQTSANLCLLYIDVNGVGAPNLNMGTIIYYAGNNSFNGNDETGACLNVQGSSYKVMRKIDNYCAVPKGSDFDIFPVILEDGNIRPYSNAVMATLHNAKEEPRGIHYDVQQAEYQLEEDDIR